MIVTKACNDITVSTVMINKLKEDIIICFSAQSAVVIMFCILFMHFKAK